MKHLERGFKENNLFILYPILVVVALISQGIFMIPIIGIIYFSYPEMMEPQLMFDVLALLKKIDANVALAALMIPMAISLFILLGAIWLTHKRSFAETVSGRKKVRWNKVIEGFGFWSVLMLAFLALSVYFSPKAFTYQFDVVQFIPLVFISILLIPLQTTCEEVMFRGYLAQGIGTWTGSRWLAMLLPSLVFALLHITNPEVKEYGMAIMLSTYFLMGLIWALSSTLDDGIELGIGAHAANNLFISLFMSQQGAVFETDALFRVSLTNPYTSLVEVVVMGILFIAFFYYRYGWSFDTLNKKVEKPADTDASVA